MCITIGETEIHVRDVSLIHYARVYNFRMFVLKMLTSDTVSQVTFYDNQAPSLKGIRRKKHHDVDICPTSYVDIVCSIHPGTFSTL